MIKVFEPENTHYRLSLCGRVKKGGLVRNGRQKSQERDEIVKVANLRKCEIF